LQVKLYSAEAGSLILAAADGAGQTYFSDPIALEGGECWQNVMLDAADLKTPQGVPLEGFDEVILLYFKTELPIILSGMLWA
jgi:hypothetical protein